MTIQHCILEHMMLGAEYLGNRYTWVQYGPLIGNVPSRVEWSRARWLIRNWLHNIITPLPVSMKLQQI